MILSLIYIQGNGPKPNRSDQYITKCRKVLVNKPLKTLPTPNQIAGHQVSMKLKPISLAILVGGGRSWTSLAKKMHVFSRQGSTCLFGIGYDEKYRFQCRLTALRNNGKMKSKFAP